MKQNLWLIALVVVAVAVGAYYFLSRPAAHNPVETAAVGVGGPTAGPGQAAADTRPQPPRLDVPMPAPPKLKHKPERVTEPRIAPSAIAERTRSAPRPLPGAGLTMNPERLKRLGLTGEPGTPKGPPINITGEHPLPAGAKLERFEDPERGFLLDIPEGWATEAPAGPGPALKVTPRGAPHVEARVYSSKVPPVTPEKVFEQLTRAVALRGETLIAARKVHDGRSMGIEVVTEIPAKDGTPALRQRGYFRRSRGGRMLQLQARAPSDSFDRYAPAFYAMSRSLGPTTKKAGK